MSIDRYLLTWMEVTMMLTWQLLYCSHEPLISHAGIVCTSHALKSLNCVNWFGLTCMYLPFPRAWGHKTRPGLGANQWKRCVRTYGQLQATHCGCGPVTCCINQPQSECPITGFHYLDWQTYIYHFHLPGATRHAQALVHISWKDVSGLVLSCWQFVVDVDLRHVVSINPNLSGECTSNNRVSSFGLTDWYLSLTCGWCK